MFCVDPTVVVACISSKIGFLEALLNMARFGRYELGRQAANTKLSSHVAVRKVRVRGGNQKFRALRLDTGNFSWGSEVGHCYISDRSALIKPPWCVRTRA